MRQFEVRELRGAAGLVVVLQSNLSFEIASRIVAPLREAGPPMLSRVHIPVELKERSYIVQLDRLAAVSHRSLGDLVGKVDAFEDPIKRGLDFLFFGT